MAKRKRRRFNNKRVTYNGVKFRSKLESYVAKRLDKLEVVWEYEPFVRLGEKWCWPDFYLPELDAYLEVRPEKLTDDKLLQKIEDIKEHTSKKCLLVHHQREVTECLQPLLIE